MIGKFVKNNCVLLIGITFYTETGRLMVKRNLL